MDWALMPLQKYAVFDGRSRRKEYWMFTLFTVVVSLILAIIDTALGTYDDTFGIGLLQGLFGLAILIPTIAVNARRLHDTGKSGWLQLLFIIPLVGFILWIVWMVKDSDAGVNKYGPSPKTPAGYLDDGAAPA